jgi:Glycosyl hydrolases family 16
MMPKGPDRVRTDELGAHIDGGDGQPGGREGTTRHARGSKVPRLRLGRRRSLLAVGVALTVGVGAVAVYAGSSAHTESPAILESGKAVAAADAGSAASLGSPVMIRSAVAKGPSPSATAKRATPKKTAAKPKKTPAGKSTPGTGTSTPGTGGSTPGTGTSTPSPGTGSGSGGAPTGGGNGDPSGQDPATSLSGFTLDYTQEFNGNSIPSNWDAYTGTPGGESSSEAQWDPSMCTYSGGEAHLNADGIDSCGLQYYGTPQIYGAWFARLQADSEPANVFVSNIFLLFPANNQWPPEIDIYEDHGARTYTNSSMYNTVGDACGSSPSPDCLAQYGQSNGQEGGTTNNDTEWHTYGVEWTPSGVNWYIDGQVVFSAPASAVKSPAAQPDTPMYMDLQCQNVSGSGSSSEVGSMSVDWVEEFSYNG